MEDPSLMKSAVEEVLRFESSNQLGNRRVVANTVLGGVAMKEGDLITICIGGANRDPKYSPIPTALMSAAAPTGILLSPAASMSAPA